MGLVGRWIDRQEPEVLRRIEAVPEEGWAPWRSIYIGDNPHGCLLCHAFDCRSCNDYARACREDDPGEGGRVGNLWAKGPVESRYMRLSARFGDSRIGRLISARAHRRLEELERAGGGNCEWTGLQSSHRLPASVTAHVRDTRDAREAVTV